MNRAVLTAAGILIAAHALTSIITRHGGESTIPSFFPAPFDTVVTNPIASDSASIAPEPTGDAADFAVAEPFMPESPVPAQTEPPPETIRIPVADTLAATSPGMDAPDEIPAESRPSIATSSDTTAASITSALVIASPEPQPAPAEPAPVAELSPADSLLLLIPERAWADSHRVRGVLTPDIAREHPTGQFAPRTIRNTAWGAGEHLVFSIDYGFLNAGTATMSVLGIEEVNSADCYHIQTTARSNDFISSFYEVRDQVNSYIDTQGIFSRRIEKLLREGTYKSDRYVDFYPDRRIAISNAKKNAVTEIPLYVQDVLSSLYLIRTYELEVGRDVYIDTYADGKVYPLRVSVDKIETVTVPAGKFTCYVVEPFLQSDGIFRQKGQLKVWLTKDEYKLPVKMTSKIMIGSIGTNLESYERGATD